MRGFASMRAKGNRLLASLLALVTVMSMALPGMTVYAEENEETPDPGRTVTIQLLLNPAAVGSVAPAEGITVDVSDPDATIGWPEITLGEDYEDCEVAGYQYLGESVDALPEKVSDLPDLENEELTSYVYTVCYDVPEQQNDETGLSKEAKALVKAFSTIEIPESEEVDLATVERVFANEELQAFGDEYSLNYEDIFEFYAELNEQDRNDESVASAYSRFKDLMRWVANLRQLTDWNDSYYADDNDREFMKAVYQIYLPDELDPEAADGVITALSEVDYLEELLRGHHESGADFYSVAYEKIDLLEILVWDYLDSIHEPEENAGLKYAVQIYGIAHDTLKDGTTGGLTFGPAIGADYTYTYKSHTPKGQTSSGNDYRCLHDDDWSTIIEWNNKDPYVYAQCLEEHCTHAVELTLTPENTAADGLFQADIDRSLYTTGDGNGVFIDGLWIKRDALLRGRANDYDELIENWTWATSSVRAALNGAQEETPEDSDSRNYSESNSLISSFPQELRDAIGEKAVRYHGLSSDRMKISTCYDKLWMLSAEEFLGKDNLKSLEDYYGGSFPYMAEEGKQYCRTKGIVHDWYHDYYAAGHQAYTVSGPDDKEWYGGVTYQSFRTAVVEGTIWNTLVETGRYANYWSDESFVCGVGFVLARTDVPTEPENPETPKESDAHEGSDQPHDGGYGSVHLYVVDKDSSAPLDGASFALYKSNGEYVGTYTTDENGHIGIPNLAASTYYFTEIVAPKGYTLDPTYLRFALERGQELALRFDQVKSVVALAPVDTTTDALPSGDAVQTNGSNAATPTDTAIITTGDDSHMVLYAAMTLIAMAALAVWGVRRSGYSNMR